MSAFDQVIGYESIKTELKQVCDMIRNREYYTRLGAKLPRGVLLYGDPGLGKTLMARCFLEESGLRTYTVRRTKGSDDFITEISDAFRLAKLNAPAAVFLDDMDKFANEDNEHRDAKEYVAVQAGIDETRGSEVFVLGTANDIDKLPDSLIRAGRFDRRIEVCTPNEEDARKIISHYLSDKCVSPDVDMDDLGKMISYNSCAELETILNEAAISAAFARKSCIEMPDLVSAVLRMEYDAPDDCVRKSPEESRRIALHEAGHVVASEVLCPGSVGLASIRPCGRNSIGGFVHRCMELPRRPHLILIALAGKAAVELFYADHVASGCQEDLDRAFRLIRDAIIESGTGGIGLMDSCNRFTRSSESFNSRSEAVIHAEVEHYLLQTRDILLKNRDFLEHITEALLRKETLLSSDIQAIRSHTGIVEIAA